ncbi:hypothetical protein CC80DRAFT_589063 [Byssothecium circinans]|uniref:Uncharacterized protein n=1 Tax=Byssothecium circinans TaxID=147558 RepID=A0A6A5UCT8_9PLEO|nr:hypothetical protein CC80DRAFT_589063 [Byssothecium circinans]
MADNMSYKAPDGELICFEIIPRETVRASLEVFGKMRKKHQQGAHIKGLKAAADKLLCASTYSWPLTIRTGSQLANSVQDIVSEAQSARFGVNNIGWSQWRDKYLSKHFNFFTSGVEIDDGLLQGGDVMELSQQMTTQWKDQTNGENLFGIQKYQDPDLTSVECSLAFGMIVEAATLKCQLFPEWSLRDKAWRDRRFADLNTIPQKLQGYISMHQERDPTLRQINGTGNMLADTGENEGSSEGSKTRRTSLTEHVLTSLESHASSPTQTDDSVAPTPPENGLLKVSYFAVLESAHDKFITNINPSRIETPEAKLLEATQEMWKWMAERGFADKASIKDVFDLTQKMTAKVADADEPGV